MEYAIVTENLTKRYGHILAVDNLNLKVQHGDICGLLGPNGAGKTTLIEMLIGALKPSSGRAEILGYDIHTNSLKVRKMIGFLPENCGFYKNMTGFRFLRYMAKLGGITKQDVSKKANELLTKVGLLERGASKISTYSGGMKQRLAIAQAFITEPAIVFLDEPTSDLDPLVREEILEMIAEYAKKGKTVVIASHILSEIKKIGDVVTIIDNGKIKKIARLETIQGKLVDFYKKAIKGEID
ncbi:MAG: ABC transporter ATP-binding protein [Candidatus Hodarchaeota archaeon]